MQIMNVGCIFSNGLKQKLMIIVLRRGGMSWVRDDVRQVVEQGPSVQRDEQEGEDEPGRDHCGGDQMIFFLRLPVRVLVR